MLQEVIRPSSIRGATWYAQYQETPVTLTLPPMKKFAPAKRTAGVSPQKLLTQMTNIYASYEDVNNGGVPQSRTWFTFGTAHAGVIKADVNFAWSGNLNNGQTVTVEVDRGDIDATDILGEQGSAGLQNIQNVPFGVGLVTSIPQAGKARLQIVNNTGQNYNGLNISLTARHYKSPTDLGRGIYNYGMRKESPVTAEFAENGYPTRKVEEGFREYYNYLKSQDPSVLSPADCFSFGDYFDPLNGYNVSLGFLGSGETPTTLRGTLQSQDTARRRGMNPDGSRDIAYYFSLGAYDYRNRIVPGYQGGVGLQHNAAGIFNNIFNIEKSYMAAPDRRVGTFGWGSFEGINSIEDKGKEQRLRLAANGAQPAGDVIRLGFGESAFEMTLIHAFYSVLVGDCYMMWNDNARFGTSVTCWDPAFLGGYDASKTKWQELGGPIVQYQEGNPTHPNRNTNCGDPRYGFSVTAQSQHNGAFMGVWLYSQIANRSNLKLKYATYSYTDNGGNKTGYHNGNTPVMGSKGDGSLNTFGWQNFGQTTIVNVWEYKKPLVVETLGTSGDALIFVNPYAGYTETTTYTVNTTNNGTVTVSIVGSALKVYTL